MMVVNHMTSLMFVRYAVTSESDTPCFCWRNDTKLPIRSNFLSATAPNTTYTDRIQTRSDTHRTEHRPQSASVLLRANRLAVFAFVCLDGSPITHCSPFPAHSPSPQTSLPRAQRAPPSSSAPSASTSSSCIYSCHWVRSLGALDLASARRSSANAT